MSCNVSIYAIIVTKLSIMQYTFEFNQLTFYFHNHTSNLICCLSWIIYFNFSLQD